MNRKFLLAITLVAMPAAGLIAVDAQAQSAPPAACDRPNNAAGDRTLDADSIIANLRAKGVNASRVESLGGCIRAYVTDANGAETMAYYHPDTLEPIGTAGTAAAPGGPTTTSPTSNDTNFNNNKGDSTMGAPTTGANAAGNSNGNGQSTGAGGSTTGGAGGAAGNSNTNGQSTGAGGSTMGGSTGGAGGAGGQTQ